MSFNTLNTLLRRLQQQPSWEPYNQFQQVLQVWPGVIKPELVTQTRPITVRREVLWVATASSVIAQHLTLQRYQLLPRLNAQLAQPLLDIRYSTAHWYKNSAHSPQYSPYSDRPATLPETLVPPSVSPPLQTPLEAFQRWTQAIAVRRENLPICPQCQGPTRPQDLTRWQMCGTCASRHWQSP